MHRIQIRGAGSHPLLEPAPFDGGTCAVWLGNLRHARLPQIFPANSKVGYHTHTRRFRIRAFVPGFRLYFSGAFATFVETDHMMSKRPGIISFFVSLYRDGFRNMTWGKPLIWLIILKLVIMFAILRVFFFKPAMRGLSDEQKSEKVGDALLQNHNTDTLKLLTD